MAWASIIPAALTIGGSLAKAGGQLKGGRATSEAAMYRAKVGQMNAQLYDQAATRVVQAGEVATDTAGLRTAARVGATKAVQGAHGIDVNKGTAVAVRAGEAQAGRLDQLTTLNNAELQGWGYRTKAAQSRAQAGLDEAEAGQATAGAGWGAAGTLLGSATSLPTGWYDKVFGKGEAQDPQGNTPLGST